MRLTAYQQSAIPKVVQINDAFNEMLSDFY